jgi:hypothetical protein
VKITDARAQKLRKYVPLIGSHDNRTNEILFGLGDLLTDRAEQLEIVEWAAGEECEQVSRLILSGGATCGACHTCLARKYVEEFL